MKAMILAAGRGGRMGGVSAHTPKPLLKIANKTLIEYHLENLARAGITDVVVNLHHLGEKVQSFLGDGTRYKLNIQYSQEDSLLGTGGGIYNALAMLGEEPFIVLSGDMWTDYDYAKLPRNIESLAHIVMVDNPPFHPHGDYQLENGKVKHKGNSSLNYAGFGVFKPECFFALGKGDYGISKVLNYAISESNLSGEHYQGVWNNLNTPEQLQTLREDHDFK